MNERGRYEKWLVQEFQKLVDSGSEKILAEGPDLAALQEHLLTLDPKTGTVPRERLIEAIEKTKSFTSDRQLKSGKTWIGLKLNRISQGG
ncbi:MAG: hypothetical protein K8R53_10460 [Bacteroidales bacterium]|nr:hypothetical protein [Bacteroidales bacterium]